MPRSAPRPFLFGALLALALVVVYAGSLSGGFLWDDDAHVTENPTIVGPLGLKEIWTTTRANYFPLVLTNFWVQHALWELHPAGYRIVTLCCHIAAAVLLWRVLARLRVPGAWLGAALWALHPVQVESVAWICELKNTQSAVFFLLATSGWLRWLEASAAAERRRYYLLTLVCAALAFLSKPSTVMLPVALGLCSWWIRGRVVWPDLKRLAPLVALAALVSGWTIWEQKFNSGAIGPEWSQTVPERFAIAGRALWFYLGKLVWPEPLVFIYPRWDVARETALSVAAIVAAGVLAAFLFWRVRNPRVRPLFFATGFYVALLFPVLGFFSVYFFRYSYVGDHFQYLASMGPLALAGASLTRAAPRGSFIAGGALLLALGLVTARHALAFRSNEQLWRDTIAKNPAATMAWLHLADTMAQAGRHEEAIATFRHALTLEPDNPHALNDLGCELVLAGRPREALVPLERSLTIKPEHADTHHNLGHALRDLGRSGAALAHYRRAIELDPKFVRALNSLGVELAEAGQAAEALELFERAHRLDPRDAATRDNLGNALRSLGRFEAAIARHREALAIDPDYPAAHANLGRTLLATGQPREALPHFERALQLQPALVRVHASYASALATVGRGDEALALLRTAVAQHPASAEAQLNLGIALASARQTLNALPYFERAVQLAPEFVAAHLNLGTALAELRRWPAAAAAFGSAVKLAPESATAQGQLAIALANAGQLEAAVPHFEAAIRSQPTAELHNQFAEVLRALGRNRAALEQLERAMQVPPAAR